VTTPTPSGKGTPECAWCEEAATAAFQNGWDDAELALCSACALELVPDAVVNDRPPTAADSVGTSPGPWAEPSPKGMGSGGWPPFETADALAAFELGEVA
jgi:hypothetical protein